MRRLALLTLVIGVGLASSASATTTYDHSFGAAGTGSGKFSSPSGIAVNHETGDVYVADMGNNRIQQFDASGGFIRMWGTGVNQTSGGNVCPRPGNPGDVCGAGQASGASGGFASPRGIGVDNSGGSANGNVYVQDAGNNRVQRFTASGDFVLMWGKGVDADTKGHVCTAASGDQCQAGGPSGTFETEPDTPSVAGQFAGWPLGGSRLPYAELAVDGAGFIYVADPHAVPLPRVQKFDPGGAFVAQIAPQDRLGTTGAEDSQGIAVSDGGDLYIISGGFSRTTFFDAAQFTPSGTEAEYRRFFSTGSVGLGYGARAVGVDPSNGFLFVGDESPRGCNPSEPAAYRLTEFHPGGQEVDCSVPESGPDTPAINHDSLGGLALSDDHRLYAADSVLSKIHMFHAPVASAPEVSNPAASEVTTNGARIEADVAANLDDTTFHVEYGTEPCSVGGCAQTPESESVGAAFAAQPVSRYLSGLLPGTEYFYRVVAANSVAQAPGPERSFTTFATPVVDESCPNHLARQQTGAALLLDCRAYELVSASDQGGYDVASSLLPDQEPYPGFPRARDRALYTVDDGGIPGVGEPTNRGPDPYLATRDAEHGRWNTRYVGIPVSAPSAAPFSSTLAGADQGLRGFAFDGPEICDPCFADGSVGIPIRKSDGNLTQGMVGSEPVANPQSAGGVRKRFSGDGTHFVFSSKQAFVSGANANGTDVTVYDRNLVNGLTQIVSTDAGSNVLKNGENVVALDVSEDGSRILIGNRASTDAKGNDYFDLYMHVGTSPFAVEVANTATGVHYAGMSSDGSHVLFTTRSNLADDTDAGVDLFRATVDAGSATVERASTGLGGTGDVNGCQPVANSVGDHWNSLAGPVDCSVVAIGGDGGGVASDDGTAYFLSPERLDGNGSADAPNLFVARPGEAPRFVATLEARFGFGTFKRAVGIAADQANGYVYVFESRTATNNVIKKFSATGDPVNFTAGSGAGTNQLNGADAPCTALFFNALQGSPAQIAVDATGRLYVPDPSKGKVDVFSPTGDCLSQISVPGPVAVAVQQSTGLVFVAGGSGASSAVSVVFEGVVVDTLNVSVQAPSPKGLAVDSRGVIYLVNNTRAVAYDPLLGYVGVVDANPSFGVTIDGDDNVYVNEGNRIARFNPTGAPLGAFGSGAIALSSAIAVSPHGVYAANNRTEMVRFDPYAFEPIIVRDSRIVTHAVTDADTRRTGDFQTTPDGRGAAFESTEPLTGFANADRTQVFRYSYPSRLDCVSCNPTGLEPESDAALAPDGLSLTDDGRVFFDTGEQLALRDTNRRRDVYEWSPEAGTDGRAELISTGISDADSGLLSVSADGTDAFFFTRQTIVDEDHNGNLVKLYDAREGGGFFVIPPAPRCVASDECHGPGSPEPPTPSIGTQSTPAGNLPGKTKSCPPGKRKVKRKGKVRCVKRRHPKKRAS